MIAAMASTDQDPIAKFIRWLEDARRAQIPNYEAMALAMAAGGGKTSVRFFLLKGIDQQGFVFFTDTRSRKGRELHGNPFASLAFYWHPKGRQVPARDALKKSRLRKPTRTGQPGHGRAAWLQERRIRVPAFIHAWNCLTVHAACPKIQRPRRSAPSLLDWISRVSLKGLPKSTMDEVMWWTRTGQKVRRQR